MPRLRDRREEEVALADKALEHYHHFYDQTLRFRAGTQSLGVSCLSEGHEPLRVPVVGDRLLEPAGWLRN
jgi:hypothetical protein